MMHVDYQVSRWLRNLRSQVHFSGEPYMYTYGPGPLCLPPAIDFWPLFLSESESLRFPPRPYASCSFS